MRVLVAICLALVIIAVGEVYGDCIKNKCLNHKQKKYVRHHDIGVGELYVGAWRLDSGAKSMRNVFKERKILSSETSSFEVKVWNKTGMFFKEFHIKENNHSAF
ncbi:hypothetical protein RRG08_066572 [Elysia crispata]|uniref:Uncharacterized protein n=1 Tax=Elysia crispata TaxID=231223 RepID=A0AAE1D4A4_9GAST|nr:hypothetical protein RRG08_066572 [Elysia crispata]